MEINKLEKSKINCNVFSAYDYNGLTMQELLCQFFTKINECVEVSNKGINILSWLQKEGLPSEVVNQLKIMIENGTLENIINKDIFNNLNDKISQNEQLLKNLKYPKIHIIPHPLDYENSDMTVIELSTGKFIMIDTGTNEVAFTYYKDRLDTIGVTNNNLEYIFFTHFHSDHSGQGANVIQYYNPKNIVVKTVAWGSLPQIEVSWQTEKLYNDIIKSARENNVNIIEATDKTFKLTELESIGVYGSPYQNYSNYNHMSIAYLFNYNNNFKMWFAGDTTIETEKWIMSNYDLPKVDVLKVAHHGWEGSTSVDFLRKISPKKAIMGNIGFLYSGGHIGDVYKRLMFVNAKIYDTKGMNEGCVIDVFNSSYNFNNSQYIFTPTWFEYKGDTYFFNADGSWVRDTYMVYKGRMCYIGIDYKLMKGTWIDIDNGNFHYADENGYLYNQRWLQHEGSWYYFDSNNLMVRNQTDYFINGGYYSFGDNGVCSNPQ